MMLLFFLLLLIEIVLLPLFSANGIWLVSPVIILYAGARGDWRTCLIVLASALVVNWFVPVDWTIMGMALLLALGMFVVFRLWIDTNNHVVSTLVTSGVATLLSASASWFTHGSLGWAHAVYGLATIGVLWGLSGRMEGVAR